MERRNSFVFLTPSYHTFVQFHKKLLLISIESSLRYTYTRRVRVCTITWIGSHAALSICSTAKKAGMEAPTE